MALTQRIGSFLRVNRWLIVSLLALGVAVYLSSNYVHQVLAKKAVNAAPAALVPVVVARQNIPPFTPLVSGDLTVKAFVPSSVPAGAVTSTATVIGDWSSETISSGMPVVNTAVFAPKAANILAARIKPGDMAVDLPLGAANVVDGLVQPGDTISLFTTITETNHNQVTEDFLNRIKVLGVNGSLAPLSSPTTGQSLTLILALPPSDVAKLLFVEQKGTVNAVLDSPHAHTAVPTPYGTLNWQTPQP